MSLIVAKFGGSSVADAKSVLRVAERVVGMKRQGHNVVVVVSAMGDSTDELLDMAAEVSRGTQPTAREMDILLSAGERISMALLAMAIEGLGEEAQAFTGPQAGLLTDDTYGEARIINMKPERITESLSSGHIAIVAGFQGFHVESFDTTTLGRGGSDTTAVALAAALNADICEICSDVDGVFSADPRVVPQARKVPFVGYEEMLELAAHGAKILHLRAVEFARRHGVTLHVRSSFSDLPGTLVCSPEEGMGMENPLITGIAADTGLSKITVVGVHDHPGVAATIFGAVASRGTNVDMVVQNVSATGTGRTDISFTVERSHSSDVLEALKELADEIGTEEIRVNDSIGKLSVVGAGVRSHPGVAAQVFSALRDIGINIEMISASEIRIAVVVAADQVQEAAQAIHTVFGLDDDEGGAIVYAGTGR